jgi:hypothetical protein
MANARTDTQYDRSPAVDGVTRRSVLAAGVAGVIAPGLRPLPSWAGSSRPNILFAIADDTGFAKPFQLATPKRGVAELYDVKADPHTMTNLVDVPAYAEIRDQLARPAPELDAPDQRSPRRRPPDRVPGQRRVLRHWVTATGVSADGARSRSPSTSAPHRHRRGGARS